MEQYMPLLTLNISHSYYEDSCCMDFIIEPTPECEKVLKGHRLSIKKSIGGIQVIAATEGNAPFITPDQFFNLEFLLKLEDSSSFVNFTTLGTITAGSVYVFSNDGLTAAGSKELAVGERARTDLPDPSDKSVFGVIQFVDNASLSKTLTSSTTYTLTFVPKTVYWQYYVIAKAGVTDILVEDALSEITFTKTDLNANPDDTDRMAQMLALQFPDEQRYLFKTTAELTYSETGRKNIQLKKNGYVLIPHMANPSIDDDGKKIIKAV